MACHGICFWTRVSKTPEKEEKGRKTVREKKDGMMDETYHAICFKKDSSFLPFPPLVFEVTMHSSVQ